ncbi:PAS domain-containing protein [Spirosoma lituiforme]
MNNDRSPLDVTKKLTEQLDVDFALKAAGLGVWEVDPVTNRVVWDDRCRELFGLSKNNELSFDQALQSIHPDDIDQVNRAVQWAMTPQSNGYYDETYRTVGADDGQIRWIRCYGKGYFSETGDIYRFAGVTQEVTQQMLAQQNEAKLIKKNEAQFRSLIEEAPVATMLMVGSEHTIEVANEAMLRLLGRDATVVGQPAITAVPELASQVYLQWLNDVFATGITHEAKAMPGELVINGLTEHHYFDFTYKPLRNPTGQVYGIISMAVDVTQQVKTQQRQDENQRQLLDLFEQSPVGLATISADDNLVIQWANTFYGEMVARPLQAVVGKPLLEAMPELTGQGFDDILKHVIATEIPFNAPEVAVDILRDGELTTIYIDLTYQPRKGNLGSVDSILVVATDVTQQVRSRREIEANERNLREMVMQAPIGICLLNASNLTIESVNAAFVEVAGKPTDALVNKPYWELFAEVAFQHEEDLKRVIQNREAFYANEVEMTLVRHGKKETIYVTFVYMPLRDGTGEIKKVAVWVLENTYQVTERQKIEKQVQQRTEELATANKELAAMNKMLTSSNEELLITSEKTIAVNEELAQSNYNLSRSNDSLEKFAYVASHDLQEPLRKILQFSDILSLQYGAQLGEGTLYLERMQSAAARMSTLIRDLLTFSRIATQPPTAIPVPLGKVIDTILDDLELRIRETGAVIDVDSLPVVPGDRLQLEQLFQNLLSNALKFHQAGQRPVVHVGYQKITRNQLPASLKAGQTASQYHQIDVTDNGVGFDEKYLDRIFQVFQRLHGRNEFAGTGIGLAICEKVVTNHGGAITARSQPGQGATFTIYLPA